MVSDGDALLMPSIQMSAHREVVLMTAREFLCLREPHILEIMLDVRQSLIEDDLRGKIMAKKLDAPTELRIDYFLDPDGAIELTALPEYVWDAVYPV